MKWSAVQCSAVKWSIPILLPSSHPTQLPCTCCLLSSHLCLPRVWYCTRHMISTYYLLNESMIKSFDPAYYSLSGNSLLLPFKKVVLLFPIGHFTHKSSFSVSCIDPFLHHQYMFFLLCSREISSTPIASLITPILTTLQSIPPVPIPFLSRYPPTNFPNIPPVPIPCLSKYSPTNFQNISSHW